MPKDFDLFVIGAGSGGVRAARVAAQLGARVAVAEEARVGGTCVNAGCIPKKLLVYASHFSEDFDDARGFGWTLGERSLSWPRLIANKDAEIARLNAVYRNLLEDAGVQLLQARATVADAHTVAVGGRQYTSEYILIATGSWPQRPQLPGIDLTITSNEAFHLPELPSRVLIVGGGYVAVEFAGILHGLGAAVTQIYRGPLFLRGFDHDIRETLATEMRNQGINLRFDADVEQIERAGRGLCARLKDGSAIEADTVLYATGRRPNTLRMGLEEVGVRMDGRGAITVDEYSRSTVPSIFAVGDCTDRLNLTPMAIAEGQAVAETLFGGQARRRPDEVGVPTAIFSQPPCATVGLSEEKARATYPRVDVYRASFRPLKHTLSGRERRAMIKLVVDRTSDRVLGCHMVGEDAAEIIQGFAVALTCGATKAQFDATIGIHPTAAEELVQMRERISQP